MYGNNFCLQQFISCDAFGICVRVFCDFGDEFVVSDPTGEEPRELFIQNITQVNETLFEPQAFYYLISTYYFILLFNYTIKSPNGHTYSAFQELRSMLSVSFSFGKKINKTQYLFFHLNCNCRAILGW